MTTRPTAREVGALIRKAQRRDGTLQEDRNTVRVRRSDDYDPSGGRFQLLVQRWVVELRVPDGWLVIFTAPTWRAALDYANDRTYVRRRARLDE